MLKGSGSHHQLWDFIQDQWSTVRGLMRSGMFQSVTPPGLMEALRILAARDFDPSNIFRVLAKNHRDKPALIFRGESLTYFELNQRIDQLAGALQSERLGKGDRVVLMLHNAPAFVEAYHAVIRCGAAAVTASYHLRGEELAHILNNSAAKALIFDDRCSQAVIDTLPLLDRPELLRIVVGRTPERGEIGFSALFGRAAFTRVSKHERLGTTIVYTSGTTGKAKGAVRDMSTLGIGVLGRLLDAIPLMHSDIQLLTCPLYHSLGQAFAMLQMAVGATIEIMPQFDPADAVESIARRKITTLVMVPTMLRGLMDLPPAVLDRYPLDSVRVIVSGAAHLPQELRERIIKRFGPVLYDLYGSTETGIVSIADSEEMLTKPGTIGRPFPGNRVRIVGEGGTALPANESGELYVKNDHTISGYFRNTKATNDAQIDGYFSVGDIARVDDDGYIFLEDRRHDMVISGGVNIYPKEIEDVLLRHAQVKDVAVFGVPDDKWGESVIAVVVPSDGMPDEDDLRSHCRNLLARFKVPKRFIFIDDLPKGNTGKVLKRQLRDQYK